MCNCWLAPRKEDWEAHPLRVRIAKSRALVGREQTNQDEGRKRRARKRGGRSMASILSRRARRRGNRRTAMIKHREIKHIMKNSMAKDRENRGLGTLVG
eukprot:6843795-Alexandrium_andersonii.AAC.1